MKTGWTFVVVAAVARASAAVVAFDAGPVKVPHPSVYTVDAGRP